MFQKAFSKLGVEVREIHGSNKQILLNYHEKQSAHIQNVLYKFLKLKMRPLYICSNCILKVGHTCESSGEGLDLYLTDRVSSLPPPPGLILSQTKTNTHPPTVFHENSKEKTE